MENVYHARHTSVLAKSNDTLSLRVHHLLIVYQANVLYTTSQALAILANLFQNTNPNPNPMVKAN